MKGKIKNFFQVALKHPAATGIWLLFTVYLAASLFIILGSYFLGRRYNIKEMPNPLSASNDEIAAYFHDVYEILDDFEDMLYSAEIFAKENGK